MGYNEKDIQRRLGVVEAVLGISLDTTGNCSGDPTTCTADPCNEERCPVQNSIVGQLFKIVRNMGDELDIYRYLIDNLIKEGVIKKAALEKAQAGVLSERLMEHEKVTLDAMEQLPDDSPLRDTFAGRLKFIRKRKEELNDSPN